ncbi:MAG: hypothetical protein M3198_11470 [Actinomycetota bacterium]|nr:hypothetical protein [Actinomycetota bacterium]
MKRLIALTLTTALAAPATYLSAPPAAAGVVPSCFGSSETTEPPTTNVLVGTEGPDKLEGTPGRDAIIGMGGADKIFGRGGNDVLCGSSDQDQADGADTIRAGAGFDFVIGGKGDDRLFGEGDRDNIFGTAGDDLIDGGSDGGIGDDANYWYFTDTRDVQANLATGKAIGQGTDTLVNIEGLGGSPKNDVLVGNNGANSFDAMGGNDKIKAGGGTDTLGMTFAESDTFINITGGTSIGASEGSDSFTGIENVIGSSHNDYVTGDGKANGLFGSQGEDTLYGRGGDDVMIGFAGYDSIFGGAGSADFVSYSDRPDLSVDLNLLSGNVTRDDGNDTLEGVEMVEGSAQADQITGDNGPNFFYADEGNDLIQGNGGSDLVFFLGAGPQGVEVDLSTNEARGMAPNLDELYGIENLVGSGYADKLVGDGGRNFLNGSDGEDYVEGAGGDDYLAGGTGDDFIGGGEGSNDLVDFFQSSKAVSASLSKDKANGEGSDVFEAIESLSGSGKGDTLEGSSAANSLYGQRGIDKLLGLGGKDRLDGGPKTDTLNGGPSADECHTKDEASACEKFSRPAEHPLTEVGRRYKKALAAARRYKRRYK